MFVSLTHFNIDKSFFIISEHYVLSFGLYIDTHVLGLKSKTIHSFVRRKFLGLFP
jgi:hypothetical protein